MQLQGLSMQHQAGQCEKNNGCVRFWGGSNQSSMATARLRMTLAIGGT